MPIIIRKRHTVIDVDEKKLKIYNPFNGRSCDNNALTGDVNGYDFCYGPTKSVRCLAQVSASVVSIHILNNQNTCKSTIEFFRIICRSHNENIIQRYYARIHVDKKCELHIVVKVILEMPTSYRTNEHHTYANSFQMSRFLC
jgi:hypothetical protein